MFLGHAAIRNTEEFVQDENEANNRESTVSVNIYDLESQVTWPVILHVCDYSFIKPV